jgi:hypothetical protein
MSARWAFEAMAVRQFKDNEYSKHFFNSNAFARQNGYYALLVDELAKDLYRCGISYDSSGTSKTDTYYSRILDEKLKRLNYHLDELSELSSIVPGRWKSSLIETKFNHDIERDTRKHLDSLKRYFNSKLKEGIEQKNSKEKELISAIGVAGLSGLKENYENESLISLALDENNPKKVLYTPQKLIQKMNPGYMKTTSKTGRAHFFAPSKMIGNTEIDTYIFDIAVIWFVTGILYVVLYFTLLKKFVEVMGNIRVKRSD